MFWLASLSQARIASERAQNLICGRESNHSETLNENSHNGGRRVHRQPLRRVCFCARGMTSGATTISPDNVARQPPRSALLLATSLTARPGMAASLPGADPDHRD